MDSPKSIRLDGLPEDVQRKILALRDGAFGGTSFVTKQQVEKVLGSLEAGRLATTRGDWDSTNAATALGKVAMRYFAENNTAKTQFKNYIAKLVASGRLVDRAGQGRKAKTNGHSEVTT